MRNGARVWCSVKFIDDLLNMTWKSHACIFSFVQGFISRQSVTRRSLYLISNVLFLNVVLIRLDLLDNWRYLLFSLGQRTVPRIDKRIDNNVGKSSEKLQEQGKRCCGTWLHAAVPHEFSDLRLISLKSNMKLDESRHQNCQERMNMH